MNLKTCLHASEGDPGVMSRSLRLLDGNLHLSRDLYKIWILSSASKPAAVKPEISQIRVVGLILPHLPVTDYLTLLTVPQLI